MKTPYVIEHLDESLVVTLHETDAAALTYAVTIAAENSEDDRMEIEQRLRSFGCYEVGTWKVTVGNAYKMSDNCKNIDATPIT